MLDRFVGIQNTDAGLNRQSGVWKGPGQTIEMSGCELETDKQKFKGIPHSLKGFDEISDFSESQYRFITAWSRSTKPGQRCRVVAAGNPPTTPEGLWVVKYWGAWLDPQHPNPAQHGELRGYTTGPDVKDVEVDGRGPHLIGDEWVEAKSRTFIPGKLSDNPDQNNAQYRATLAALPAEYRAAYRDGRFDTAIKDDAFQTIPAAWVYAAFDRWTPNPPPGVPQCAIGVDVAQGGDDNTVLAMRYDGWYDKLLEVKGKDTPDGRAIAGLVVQHRRDQSIAVVDVGGGWGGKAIVQLSANGIPVTPYLGVEKSGARTADKQLAFSNVRSEAYWRFREALDPSQPQGSTIALPRDAVLVADLCAPRYKITGHGIVITAKEDIVKQIGRSPDKGDAVVMAWWDGVKQINLQGGWKAARPQHTSTANMSRRPRHHRRK